MIGMFYENICYNVNGPVNRSKKGLHYNSCYVPSIVCVIID